MRERDDGYSCICILYIHKPMFGVCSTQFPQIGITGVQQGGIPKNRGIIIIKKNREQMNEANIKQPKPCYLFQSTGLDAGMGQNGSQMGFKEKSRYECQYLI